MVTAGDRFSFSVFFTNVSNHGKVEGKQQFICKQARYPEDRVLSLCVYFCSAKPLRCWHRF